MKAKRAAIYARVSTDENRQDPETQLRELRDFAERRGFEVVGEYIDHASGKTEERANYKRLLEDARRRRLDVVLVWRYDRFVRPRSPASRRIVSAELMGLNEPGADILDHGDASPDLKVSAHTLHCTKMRFW